MQAAWCWNLYDEYGCLYTALTREGAVAEYRKVLSKFVELTASDDARRDLVSIHVSVGPVLDLTDQAVLDLYRVSKATLTSDDESDVEICRSIADLARARQYRAILSPSASMEGAVNLNIYLEERTSELALRDGPDREALNY